MAKINGIKGVKISRDEFRDSKSSESSSNTKQNLDEAMIQMLLGQVRYLNAKAEQIEENMRISAKKEEERQQKEAEYRAKKEKNEQERNKRETQRKIENFTNTELGKGAINLGVASLLGPAGLAFGWMLNKSTGGIIDKGFNKLLSGAGLFSGSKKSSSNNGGLGSWSTSSNVGSSLEGNDALSVNRREMAVEPINRLNTTVASGFKQVIELLGGKWNGQNDGKTSKSDGLLSGLFGGLGGGFLGGLTTGLLGTLKKWFLPAVVTAGAGYLLYQQREENKEKYGEDIANIIERGEITAGSVAAVEAGKALQKGGVKLRASTTTRVPAQGLKGVPTRALNAATKGTGNTLYKLGGNFVRVGRFTNPALQGVGSVLDVVDGYDNYEKTGDERELYIGWGKGIGAVAGGAIGAMGGPWVSLGASLALEKLGGTMASQLYTALHWNKASKEEKNLFVENQNLLSPVYRDMKFNDDGTVTQGEYHINMWGMSPLTIALGKILHGRDRVGGTTLSEDIHNLIWGDDKKDKKEEDEQQFNYTTAAPNLLNNDDVNTQILLQIRDSLEQMEMNTRPSVMQELDNKYITNLENTLDKTAPIATSTDDFSNTFDLLGGANPLGF